MEKSAVMPHVPGLRSCSAKIGLLIYFGHMLDKIRLHAAAKLPVSGSRVILSAAMRAMQRCP